jgi:phage terminase Nu1 subunit (DNA packaging protein)
MTPSKRLIWPAEKMAKLIDLTPRRLRQLVEEGVVPREERGRYNPFVVTVAYIRFLRDRAQSPELSNAEFYEAKLKKLKAECEQIELQNQITRKERIPIDDILSVADEVFQAIAGALKANRDKVLTEAKINQIFGQLREAGTRMLAPTGEQLKNGADGFPTKNGSSLPDFGDGAQPPH